MKKIHISQDQDGVKYYHEGEITPEFEALTSETVKDVSFILGKSDLRKLRAAIRNGTADALMESYIELFSNKTK